MSSGHCYFTLFQWSTCFYILKSVLVVGYVTVHPWSHLTLDCDLLPSSKTLGSLWALDCPGKHTENTMWPSVIMWQISGDRLKWKETKTPWAVCYLVSYGITFFTHRSKINGWIPGENEIDEITNQSCPTWMWTWTLHPHPWTSYPSGISLSTAFILAMTNFGSAYNWQERQRKFRH